MLATGSSKGECAMSERFNPKVEIEQTMRFERSAYEFDVARYRVWVFASYWGGPAGNLEHIHAMWEYADGRREPLTAPERTDVLLRLMDYIKRREGFAMRAKELE